MVTFATGCTESHWGYTAPDPINGRAAKANGQGIRFNLMTTD